MIVYIKVQCFSLFEVLQKTVHYNFKKMRNQSYHQIFSIKFILSEEHFKIFFGNLMLIKFLENSELLLLSHLDKIQCKPPNVITLGPGILITLTE